MDMKQKFFMSFLRLFRLICRRIPRIGTWFRDPCQTGILMSETRKEPTMQGKPKTISTHYHIMRIIPTRTGRRREYSGTAVKALGQKHRPAFPLFAETGTAGIYIEGRLSPGAAAATPAGFNTLRPDLREASAAALYRARSNGRQRGVITKHHHNKIETDLSWVCVTTFKALIHNGL